MPKTEKQWEIEGAAGTLIEAEKIKQQMKRDAAFRKSVRAELKKRTAAATAAANAATTAAKG
jgi:hypothetical protein